MRATPCGRRPRTGLLLALLVPLALGACGPQAREERRAGGGEGDGDGDREGGAAMSPAPVAGAVRLVAGQAMEGDLSLPSPHLYEVAVPAGHYLRVVARQLGLDVALRLAPPAGAPDLRFDSPSGAEGEEAAHAVAEAAGVYRIEVELDAAPPAGVGYQIRVADLRPATAEDRLRAAAEAALAVAEASRRAAPPGDGNAYRAALALAERLGDRRLLAYVLYRLSAIDARQGRPAEARAGAERSLELAAALGDAEAQAKLLNRIAHLERGAGRVDQALEHQRRALALYREMGDDDLVAGTLAAYGQTLDWAGRPLDAVGALHEALDIRRRRGDRRGSIDPHLWLGDVHLALQQLERAADHFAEAARLAREAGDAQAEAIAERGSAARLSRAGQAAEAVPHLRRALALARRIDDERLASVILGDLGTAELKRGQVEEARKALGESLAISRRRGDLRNQAFALHKLARCHHEVGEHRESARLHLEAAALFERLGDPASLAGAHYGRARSLRRTGALEEALGVLESALAAADGVRWAAGGDALRTSFAASKQHYRELHVDLLMELDARHPGAGHDLAALFADDRGRARALLDLLEQSAEVAATSPPEAIAERRDLQVRLASLQRFGERLAETGGSDEAMADVERQQRALLGRLDRVRAEARRTATTDRDAPEPRAWSQQRLDALLDSETLVLVYSLGEERSVLWAVWRGGRHSVLLPPRPVIEVAADRAAAAFARARRSARDGSQDAAAELSRLVLGPVADLLPQHRRLAVVADGALLHVPFAALTGPGKPPAPLVDTHEVVSVPSLSVLERLRRRRPPARWRGLAAVVADPVFDARDPRLAGEASSVPAGAPIAAAGDALVTRALGDLGLGRFERLAGTRAEADALLSLLPPDAAVYRAFDFAADRQAVLGGALAGHRIVHLATHGVLDRRRPELSGLVFSLFDEDGRPRDGYLPLHEVYDLDLDAEVIVLSACQSGLGREMNGEGLVGLTRGFLEAGVPRLVVSLWQVGDRGSAELMRRFYRAWLVGGETPSAALAAAQRSMWHDAEWSAPYHWAGFQFVGDWTATEPLRLDRDESLEGKEDGTEREAEQDDDLPGPPGDEPEPPGR